MQIGVDNEGRRFVEVTSPQGLVGWVLEQKAFHLSPSRPIGPWGTSLGPMNDVEMAIYTALHWVRIEIVGTEACIKEDVMPEEVKGALRWQLKVLKRWESELVKSLETNIENHFIDQLPDGTRASDVGICEGFQVVLFQKQPANKKKSHLRLVASN